MSRIRLYLEKRDERPEVLNTAFVRAGIDIGPLQENQPSDLAREVDRPFAALMVRSIDRGVHDGR